MNDTTPMNGDNAAMDVDQPADSNSDQPSNAAAGSGGDTTKPTAVQGSGDDTAKPTAAVKQEKKDPSNLGENVLNVLKTDIMLNKKVAKASEQDDGIPVVGMVKFVFERSITSVDDKTATLRAEKLYRAVYPDDSFEDLSFEQAQSRIVFDEKKELGVAKLVQSKEQLLKEMQNSVVLPETLLGVWIITSGGVFKIYKELTIGEFELGLVLPENNDLMAGIHTRLLVTDTKELKKMANEEKLRRVDGGYNRPFVWWITELYKVVTHWYDDLKECRQILECVDELYNGKQKDPEDQTDLDRYAATLTDEDIGNLEWQVEQLEFLMKDLGPKCPFDYSQDASILVRAKQYLEFSPLVRVQILNTLIKFRVWDEQSEVYASFRAYEPETLRHNTIGADSMGRRYFYFSQFHKECRVYVETPAGFLDHYGPTESDDEGAEEIKRKKEEEAKRKRQEEEERLEMEKRAAAAALEAQKKEEARLNAEEVRRIAAGRRPSRRAKLDAIEKVKKTSMAGELAKQEAVKRKKLAEEEKRKKREAAAKEKKQRGRKRGKQRSSAVSEFGLFDGAEPEPEKWRLVCSDLAGLVKLITKVNALRNRENEDLLFHLRELESQVKEEAAKVENQKQKFERMLKLEAMPKKRSNRIASGRLKKLEEDALNQKRMEEEAQRRAEEERQHQKRMKQREERQRQMELERQQAELAEIEVRKERAKARRELRAKVRSGGITQAEYERSQQENIKQFTSAEFADVQRVKVACRSACYFSSLPVSFNKLDEFDDEGDGVLVVGEAPPSSVEPNVANTSTQAAQPGDSRVDSGTVAPVSGGVALPVSGGVVPPASGGITYPVSATVAPSVDSRVPLAMGGAAVPPRNVGVSAPNDGSTTQAAPVMQMGGIAQQVPTKVSAPFYPAPPGNPPSMGQSVAWNPPVQMPPSMAPGMIHQVVQPNTFAVDRQPVPSHNGVPGVIAANLPAGAMMAGALPPNVLSMAHGQQHGVMAGGLNNNSMVGHNAHQAHVHEGAPPSGAHGTNP